MLDGLLSRGFAAKCKSLIKLTKVRIEVIRRKRRATEKFLKKDIADLLASGLDINAYGRAEGLMVELTLSSCYGFVDKSCEIVLKHLPVMQKLSGCPEECRVAVSSLMFAAARFSDLPELRDLRQIFQERYGNSLECYVNKEFAANLNFKSSTLEKVCLMEEIASEFSINWDSKAFKLRMSRTSSFAQGQNACMSNHLSGYDKPFHGKDFNQKGVKNDVLLKKSPDHANDGYRFQKGKEAVILNRDDHDLQSTVPGNILKPLNGCEFLQKREGRDNPLTKRREVTDEKSDRSYWKDSMLKPIGQEVTDEKSDRGYWKEGSMLKPIGRSSQEKTVEQLEGGSKLHDSLGNTTPLRENQDTPTARKSPSHIGSRFRSNVKGPFIVNHVGLPDTDKSERKVQKDETPTTKPCYSNIIPPPYVKLKPNSKQQSSTRGAHVVVSSHTDSGCISTYYSAHDKTDAASISEKTHFGLDNADQDWQTRKHEKLSKQSHEREFSMCEDAKEVRLVKPKCMRRKHSRSRSNNHYDATNVDAGLVRKSRSRSRRRNESRHGLQSMFDDEQYQNAEEERVIDKLLIHYSQKPSILAPEIVRKRSNSHHALLMDNSTRELLQNGRSDEFDETPGMANLAPRSISLSREQPRVVEVKKAFARAATFQPDRSNEARHVHPKLPDYDDLTARFAALRGQ